MAFVSSAGQGTPCRLMGRIKARVLSSALRASAPPDVAKSEASQAVGPRGGKDRRGRVLAVSAAPALQKPPEQLLWKKKKSWLFCFCLFSQKGTNFRWSSWSDQRHKRCDFSAFGEHLVTDAFWKRPYSFKKKKIRNECLG